MNQYKSLVSQLQSRISLRATAVTEQEQWKQYYRAIEQMADWRNTKVMLKSMHKCQSLDKLLLKVVQELAYCDDLVSTQQGIISYFSEGF